MEEFFQSFKEKWWDPSKAFQYLHGVEICGGIGPTRNDEERESCHHGTSESCQEQKHADEIILEEKVNDYESLHECTDEEWLKYMLSLSSGASSLNSVSHSPCDTTRAMLEYSPRRPPSALEEAAREFTENTYQEEYASARPLSDSSAKLQADSDEMSSNEEGLLSKENHPDTETVAVKDSLEQRDQEFKQSKQPNCICACHQRNVINVRQLQDKIEDLLHRLGQLQVENMFYLDRCLKQEEKITQLKENLTQMEEEKQGLESEMGRQLFLEDKNKRQSKLYEPFTEHCHEQIMPNAASGEAYIGEDGFPLDYTFNGPLSDSSAKLQADSDEMSSNEEGLLSKENQDKSQDLLHKLDQLQAENIFYVDRCLNQEKEVAQLKENLTQIEEEKQGLESEVGRQLFLEDKNKRQSKLYQPFTEHCHEQIMPNAASGASFHVTGLDGEQLDKAGPCNNSDIYKADSSSGRCGFASSCSQSSSSSAVNVQSLTKDLHSAEIITGLNPDHPALMAWKNSGESAYDTTSGGEEEQERSMPLLLTSECFESEEEEQGCASKEEGGKEGSGNSTSICDGAVNASYLIQHCNAVYVVDSPDYTSSRAQDSVKLKNVSGVSQDLLPPEGMPQKQSVSCATTTAQKGAVLVPFDSCTISHLNTWECEGARPKNATLKQNVSRVKITAKKESGVDQSDSYMSSESIKWEHLGARPRDRTPKGDSSFYSSSLLSSLVDLVPQQVGEPVVLGVDNAFLTRHSVDKPLGGSLYYNYAEMLAEDMDSMMNMIDSNQAKPYLGDCQAAAMSDPYYQPYSSAFPLPSEAYIGEDGFPLDYTFNGNSVLPPGPSSSHVGASMSQNGHLTSLQRSDFLQSGFTSSGLTSDFLGTTGPQMTHSVIGTQSNIGFTGSTSILHPEPLQMQTPSTTNVGLLERYNEMPTTCNVDSLDSTHNSPQAFVQGVRDAWMRVSAQFRRWWCTCSAQYDQDASPAVCTTCNKYRYLGQPRVQSFHDECCICHMDLSSGLLILPCSHRAHMKCTFWLIQHNILHCPSCFGVFFHQDNCAPRCSPRLFK